MTIRARGELSPESRDYIAAEIFEDIYGTINLWLGERGLSFGVARDRSLAEMLRLVGQGIVVIKVNMANPDLGFIVEIGPEYEKRLLAGCPFPPPHHDRLQ